MDVFFVVLSGTMAGKLQDPLAIVMMLLAFALGAARLQWYFAIALTFIIFLINVIAVWDAWQFHGINPLDRMPLLGIALLCISVAAYIVGRAVNSTVRVNREAKKYR